MPARSRGRKRKQSTASRAVATEESDEEEMPVADSPATPTASHASPSIPEPDTVEDTIGDDDEDSIQTPEPRQTAEKRQPATKLASSSINLQPRNTVFVPDIAVSLLEDPKSMPFMKKSITRIAKEVSEDVRLDDDVNEYLAYLANDFVGQMANFSCRLASHRGSAALEARDLEVYLDRYHGIQISKFMVPVTPPEGQAAAAAEPEEEPESSTPSRSSEEPQRRSRRNSTRGNPQSPTDSSQPADTIRSARLRQMVVAKDKDRVGTRRR